MTGAHARSASVVFLVSWMALLSCESTVPDAEPSAGQLPEELGRLVQRYEALGRFSGAVAVAIDGQPLFAAGYGMADREAGVGNTPRTSFDLGSLTKQFTAAAILKLEADALLRVEDPISAHLPRYPRPQGDRVTLHHLLSHSSGIPSLWRLGDGLDDVEATAEPVSVERLLGFFQDRELLFEPGERFRYSNSGYVVLAAIIEEVSGRPYADYLDEALFRPLGMNDTGCRTGADAAWPYQGHPPDVNRAAMEHPSWSIGDGCVRSTVLDLVKWDAALRDDGFLPRAQREKLFVAHSEVRPGVGYGYGWFLSQKHGRPAVHHSGAGEGVIAEMYRYPEERLSIVALANYAPEIGVNAPGAIIGQAAALHFDLPTELPQAVFELPAGEAERLTGRYSIEGGGFFDVEVDDGRLWIEGVGGTASVFDFGVLEDSGMFEKGAEVAKAALSAGLGGDFDSITICGLLGEDMASGELEEEWQEILGGHGALVEMTPAQIDRYPGEATLIVVTRLQFEQSETFFSLDVTPELEVCGWYTMDRGEFEVRSSFSRPRRVPLVPVGPNELLADGFNWREQDVRLEFHFADAHVELLLKGAVQHTGHRSGRAVPAP